MNARRLIIAMGLAQIVLLGTGCGESVPVNTMPTDGSNPHVSGSPEDRIKAIEADTSLPPEERARRIALVKERNHLK